jgi:hypothetical protein
MRIVFFLAMLLASPIVRADEQVAALIEQVQSVGAEGQGNEAAQKAWKSLGQQSPQALPDILAGFSGANELAINWLAAAVEQIAQRALRENPEAFPKADLEAFLMDQANEPRARRLAYELILEADPDARERLIPQMLHDPSVELRRDAVAKLIDQAKSDLRADKKDEAVAMLEKALDAARDLDQVEDIAKQLGNEGREVDLARHFGFLMNWRLIAPFDNTDESGFDVAYPPEEELNFAAKYEGKGQEAVWSEHTTEDKYGLVDLNKVLARHKGAIAYAATTFESDKAQTVDMRLGSPTAWKLWVNGELIFAREEYHRGTQMDQYRVQVPLRAGTNKILLKICQNEMTQDWAQRWQFQIRVCDATGTAILPAEAVAE